MDLPHLYCYDHLGQSFLILYIDEDFVQNGLRGLDNNKILSHDGSCIVYLFTNCVILP